MPLPTNNWYFATGNQRQGPVGVDDLRRLALQGKLSKDDLVWTKGMKEWQEASTVEGLFPKSAITPAPAAAPTKPMLPPRASSAQPIGTKPKTSPDIVAKASSKVPVYVGAGIVTLVILIAAGYWLLDKHDSVGKVAVDSVAKSTAPITTVPPSSPRAASGTAATETLPLPATTASTGTNPESPTTTPTDDKPRESAQQNNGPSPVNSPTIREGAAYTDESTATDSDGKATTTLLTRQAAPTMPAQLAPAAPPAPSLAPMPQPAPRAIVKLYGLPASFDCRNAATATENAICASGDLQNLDGELGQLFSDVIAIAPASKLRDVRAEQRAWLKERDATCNGDQACLFRYYNNRLGRLKQVKANGFPAETPTPALVATGPAPSERQSPPPPQSEAPSAPALTVDSITFGHSASANGQITKPDAEFGDKDTIYASIRATVQSSAAQSVDVVWADGNGQVLQRDRGTWASGPHVSLFNYSNPNGLPVGQYRLSVYVNSKLISNNSFSIEPSRLDRFKNGLEKFGIKVQTRQQ